jgi:hypothetical protein
MQLDVSILLPPCIGPSGTSKIVKTSSKYCTILHYRSRFCASTVQGARQGVGARTSTRFGCNATTDATSTLTPPEVIEGRSGLMLCSKNAPMHVQMPHCICTSRCRALGTLHRSSWPLLKIFPTAGSAWLKMSCYAMHRQELRTGLDTGTYNARLDTDDRRMHACVTDGCSLH